MLAKTVVLQYCTSHSMPGRGPSYTCPIILQAKLATKRSPQRSIRDARMTMSAQKPTYVRAAPSDLVYYTLGLCGLIAVLRSYSPRGLAVLTGIVLCCTTAMQHSEIGILLRRADLQGSKSRWRLGIENLKGKKLTVTIWAVRYLTGTEYMIVSAQTRRKVRVLDDPCPCLPIGCT
jgi:hypothetical protein